MKNERTFSLIEKLCIIHEKSLVRGSDGWPLYEPSLESQLMDLLPKIIQTLRAPV